MTSTVANMLSPSNGLWYGPYGSANNTITSHLIKANYITFVDYVIQLVNTIFTKALPITKNTLNCYYLLLLGLKESPPLLILVSV